MTELKIYKFIIENKIEWHWRDNKGTEDVIIFLELFNLEEFYELAKDKADNCDHGIEVILKNGYAIIWMSELLDYYGIDLNEIFTDKTN